MKGDEPALLSERFARIRAQTLALAEGLSPEDCQLQSMPDASPVKWHLAHTAWFFETFVIVPSVASYRVFDTAFRSLFNSYYVGVGERAPRAERGLMSRPTLAGIIAYRAHVDDAMRQAFEASAFDAQTLALIELGMQHEQQHQELIVTDLKHNFSRNPLHPAYRPAWVADPAKAVSPPQRFVAFEGGLTQIGHDGSGFAFDNETPRHRVFIEPFELASRLVTNAEYAAFIADRGYQRPELWLSDGWDAVQREGWRTPLYWLDDRNAYTLAGRREVVGSEPVCHVSFYEADAYARWADARLATEFEWELAACAARREGNFVERGAFHPCAASDDVGIQQLFGDVWEWTHSAYLPYPGYRPATGAVGEYNGKFMINQMVLRGGSCATPRDHIRGTYRNFFPPAVRWQFSGIRLARS